MNRWIDFEDSLEAEMDEYSSCGDKDCDCYLSEDEMAFFDRVAFGIAIGAASLFALLLSIHLVINMMGD